MPVGVLLMPPRAPKEIVYKLVAMSENTFPRNKRKRRALEITLSEEAHIALDLLVIEYGGLAKSSIIEDLILRYIKKE